MVIHLKIALSAGYRLLPQRAQKTAMAEAAWKGHSVWDHLRRKKP
jgi:hypothetical protein